MDEKGFKKLLIDLEVTPPQVATAVGISRWAVILYFRGELRSVATRVRIKRVLHERAREMRIPLPKFWEDAAA